MTSELDVVDRNLLNIIQAQFLLVEEPFAYIGRELGIAETEGIDRIEALKDRNVVRQISAIFDTRRLGYKTTLVAMRLAEDRLEAGAHVINEHPGVSHNYARNGHFNLWFTLAVPPNESLEDTVVEMVKRTKVEAFRLMPTIKFFKIGVNFDMIKEEGASTKYYSPDGYNLTDVENWNKAESLTNFEIAVIRELQEDVPLISKPFTPMAERLGIPLQALFNATESFQQRGLMRRFSAVLHHRRAGFKSNAMAVWKVPSERAVEVGNIMAQSKWVTHCYERPTFPDWQYTHFTMIHATSQEQFEVVVREISEATSISKYQLLYGTREYKKTRVRYFV